MGNRPPGATMSDLNQPPPQEHGDNPLQWCPCRVIALLMILAGLALLVRSI